MSKQKGDESAFGVAAGSAPSFQDRRPNFRDEEGNLYLVRCYHCSPEHGRENYAPAVATGTCAWCGWPNGADQPRPREKSL